MALQIRRGLEAARTAVTPAAGELLVTTDGKLVYVGDGTTPGGTLVGIRDIIQDLTPQLGGNLDTNGYSISNSLGSLSITSNTTITGTATITSNTYQVNLMTLSQHHSSQDSSNFMFLRSRGTRSAPLPIVLDDTLGEIHFAGYTGSTYYLGGSISSIVSDTPTSTTIPAILKLQAYNGPSISGEAQLDSTGAFKVNQLAKLTSLSLRVEGLTIDNNTVTTFDASPIIFQAASQFNSTTTIDGILTVNAHAAKTASALTLTSDTRVSILQSPLKLAQFTTIARDAIVAENGDLIYNTDLNKFQGYENGAWVNLI